MIGVSKTNFRSKPVELAVVEDQDFKFSSIYPVSPLIIMTSRSFISSEELLLTLISFAKSFGNNIFSVKERLTVPSL